VPTFDIQKEKEAEEIELRKEKKKIQHSLVNCQILGKKKVAVSNQH